MGKSSKKTNPKVEAAPAAVAPTSKSSKKGKREAEEDLEKLFSAKKQKVSEKQALQKKKIEVKTQQKKKKQESSSSDESSSSESEDEKVVAPTKKVANVTQPPQESSSEESSSDEEPASKVVFSKKQTVNDKKISVGVSAKKVKPVTSSETSDSETSDSDSDDEEDPKSKVTVKSNNLQAAAAKNSLSAAQKKKVESSDGSETGTSDEDEEKTTKATEQLKKLPTPTLKKTTVVASKIEDSKESSDEEDSDSDSEDEDIQKTSDATRKSKPAALPKKKESESSSESESSEESDSDEDATVAKVAPSKKPLLATETKKSTKEKMEIDEDDSSEESDEDESDEEEIDRIKPKVSSVGGKPSVTSILTGNSSDEESTDESEGGKRAVRSILTGNSSDEETSDERQSDDEEESEDEKAPKTPEKKITDVEMLDGEAPGSAKTRIDTTSQKKNPKSPITPHTQSTGSKTLFVGNLDFNISVVDAENFFKNKVGDELVEVRLAVDAEGKFRGFGHAEFATTEAAQKALELQDQMLGRRAVHLDMARERTAYTPQSGKENGSFQKGGRSDSQTLFIRGFDNSLGEDQVRSSLEEHFASCGEIKRISLPKEYGTDTLKGIAYVEFNDGNCFNKALELNGTEVGGNYLTVEEAKPRGDSASGGRGGRGGGRGGGGRFGGRDSGGRFGGRDSGGRFGGRQGGGRRGGGGGGFRGRGTPNRPSMATPGTGTKKKFDD